MTTLFVFLVCLTGLASAQLFTCNDTVTLCLVGVETCCCQQPLTVVCQCCEPTEMCFNGTCALPSLSPTETPSLSMSSTPSPSPSPSGTPMATITATPSASLVPTAPCSQLSGDTLTCSGSLVGETVVIPRQVSIVAGDLVLTPSTTLELTASGTPVVVQDGSVVVAGTIAVVVTTPVVGGDFLPLIEVEGDGTLEASESVVVSVSGPGVPEPERTCEQYTKRPEVRGAQFGVLFEVDDSQCSDGGGGSDSSWTYSILVPAVVGTACLIACCVVGLAAVATLLFWHRMRGTLWANDDDDEVVDTDVPRISSPGRQVARN